MTSDTGPARAEPEAGAARRAFLSAAVRRPATMGAIAPSSPRLGAVLASIVPSTGAPVVVELGPGTGAVSAVIAQRLPAGARHLAVELDPDMVTFLRRSRPELEVVPGNAANLGALLAERDVSSVDAVICGLPWALFDDQTQAALLAEISGAIGSTGAFTTFAYLHGMTLGAARRFRRTLRETFDEVLVTATVWRNLPPAFVYVCRRPRTPAE
ncbi:MAG TPA: methyltransferase domain-containing protein [Pseudonocardia sp.]|jgi:phospholipid N-methyltransferase